MYPAFARQLGHEHHQRFRADVEGAVGVDRDVVRGYNEAVGCRFQRREAMEVVEVDAADLNRIGQGHAMVAQRIAPEEGVQADCVGVLLSGLLGA